MKLNKRMFIILITIMIIIALVFVISNKIKSKTVTCTLSNELIEGFYNEEEITINFKKNAIYSIDYNRKISLSDEYASYGTYTNSLDKVLNNGYKYLDDFTLDKDSNKVSYNINLKNSGIILNNLTIEYSNYDDTTSLKYNIDSNLDSSNAIKVGDKTNKKEITNKLKDLGYTCK